MTAKTYDIETSFKIDDLRLKQRKGPKPNANSHIKIYPMKMDYSQVGFTITRRTDANARNPKR